MLHEVLLPRAAGRRRGVRSAWRATRRCATRCDRTSAAAAWFDEHATTRYRKGQRCLKFQQWQDLLTAGGGGYKYDPAAPATPGRNVGEWTIPQDSEVTGDERCRRVVHKVKLSIAQAKAAFASQYDELGAGQMTTRRRDDPRL